MYDCVVLAVRKLFIRYILCMSYSVLSVCLNIGCRMPERGQGMRNGDKWSCCFWQAKVDARTSNVAFNERNIIPDRSQTRGSCPKTLHLMY